jgi:hypothetical protein
MSAKIKRRVILIGGICCLVFAVYFLTAPFVLPHVIHRPIMRAFYSPVIHSIEEHWFGCEVVRWYCFDVCHMKLLMPLQYGPEDL